MLSRYDEADAERTVRELGGPRDVALRVYTSRLIGSEPSLVLHGGGNTSVKGTFRNLLGDELEGLWVKGSGSSLDKVTPRDFPLLDLAYLRRLRALGALSDEEMVNELRTHLFDASSPNPSVEALLHAFLPHRFVDHSHADAIVTLTNQADPEALVREALGDRVVVLPYIMPGFPLAKAVAELYDANPSVEGVVLAKHGLFTFGATARESYERHIALVDATERLIAKRLSGRALVTSGYDPDLVERRVALAAPILRGLLIRMGGKRFVMEHRGSEAAVAYSASREAEHLTRLGPLTPDHVIRTKSHAAFVARPSWDDAAALTAELTAAVQRFRDDYDAYFDAEAARRPRKKTKLDVAPRVLVVEGIGALSFGVTKKDARIAADLTDHTMVAKWNAEMIGRYEALPDGDLFDMEYWSLEQAKLGKAKPRVLEGRVALVTGGAGAIGQGIAEVLVEAGAHVVVLDSDEAAGRDAVARLEARHGSGIAAFVRVDVTDGDAMRLAFDRACVLYGGVDLVVPNAGVAFVKPIAELSTEDARRVSDVNYLGVLHAVREAARVFAAQGIGGDIVINASKNVFAPGKDFGAYSASKAAAHQLGKVAAIELAPLGVRVNQINADAVFSHGDTPSGLWREVGPSRATSRGLEEAALPDFYRDRNLLKVRVSAREVGEAVLFFASGATPTTGATLPVDGGVAEAFPR